MRGCEDSLPSLSQGRVTQLDLGGIWNPEEGDFGSNNLTYISDRESTGPNRMSADVTDGVDAPSRRHRDVPRWYFAFLTI